jgi:hypothetical protein
VIFAGPAAVCFEKGIERAVAIITGGFLDKLSDLQLTKKVYIMELNDFVLLCMAFSQKNCEERLLASSCLSVRPSVLIKQLGTNCTDLHEISY